MTFKSSHLVLCWSAVAFSVLVYPFTTEYLAKSHIQEMKDDGSLTNVIEMIVTNGTFCAVRGHTWGQHLHVTLEYSERIGCRECKICKLHQSQYASEWK